MLSIFIFTVMTIVLRPFPMGTIAFFGLTLIVVTKTLTFAEAFSGFAHPVIWLIVIAFFISRGFIKTGLGERIAYLIIRNLGQSSLGMGYGMVLTDLLLAPAIPSVVARVGGIVYPIVNALAKAFGSEPHSHPKRLGAFLMKVTFQGSVITAGMFLTAMAGNSFIANSAGKVGVHITWGKWAIAASLPGLICLALVPLVLYKIYPPEMKRMPGARDFAKKKLEEMGRVSVREWVMVFAFFLLITLWILGSYIAMEAVVAALIGLTCLLLTSILTWEDIAKEKGAWGTLLWFAVLLMMATFLSELGLTAWFTHWVQRHVSRYNQSIVLVALPLIYFYSHYFFVSIIAHVSAMYAPFLFLMIALGVSPVTAAMLLGFLSSCMGGLTHYGCGPAPIFFGSGYVKVVDWWKLGFYTSVVNVAVYLTIGTVWWGILGYC